MPASPVNKEILPIPNDLKLADENFHKVGAIDLLIGGEIFWHILGNKQLSFGINCPVLQETQLGWVVAGKLQCNSFLVTYCNLVKNEINIEIQDQLAEFFKLEDVKVASP